MLNPESYHQELSYHLHRQGTYEVVSPSYVRWFLVIHLEETQQQSNLAKQGGPSYIIQRLNVFAMVKTRFSMLNPYVDGLNPLC